MSIFCATQSKRVMQGIGLGIHWSRARVLAGHYLIATYICVPLVIKQYNFVSAKGQWCSSAGK